MAILDFRAYFEDGNDPFDLHALQQRVKVDASSKILTLICSAEGMRRALHRFGFDTAPAPYQTQGYTVFDLLVDIDILNSQINNVPNAGGVLLASKCEETYLLKSMHAEITARVSKITKSKENPRGLG